MFRICWGAGPSALIATLQICTQLPQFSRYPRHGFFDTADIALSEIKTRAVRIVQAFLQPDWTGLICIYQQRGANTSRAIIAQITVTSKGET